ncbi:Rne/Rng family ribonuclease [Promicromonospora sukumoe]|uniref:Ribonuclease E n=1 Tax=Promicromonospora sukumoe TaxID=88382 RepID=A0A7W3JBA1_9MICO|nr:Rne/Rng family ribonuclease [Promicromonospora sukumoe]MBA8809671.1 ribonuclease E [Promicromonospora sukumoe]
MTPSSTTGSTIGSQDDHDAPEANAQVTTGGEAPADAAPAKRPRRRATRSVVSTASHVEPIVVGPSDAPAAPVESQPVTTGGTAAVATSATPAAGEPAAKRPRRRATRGVSSPTAPAPEAAAAQAPAEEPTPVQPVAAEPVVAETDVTEQAPAVVAEPEAETTPEAIAETTPPAEPEAAVAAEPVAEPVTELVAEPEAPAEQAAPLDLDLPQPVAPAEAPAREVASLDDIVLPGGPAADASAPADKAAPKRRTRKKAEPTAEAVTAEPSTEVTAEAETTAEVTVEAEPAAEPAPKRSRSRRKPASAEAEQAVETPAEPAAAAPEAPVEETPAEPATRSRTRRGGRRPAFEQPEAPAQPATSPAATTSGTRVPRLATTALLFQAPDDSAARRSRRAQAPAGPPRDLTPQFARPVARPVESVPERPAARTEAPSRRTAERAAEQVAEAPAVETPAVDAPAEARAETVAEPRTRRSGSRRAVRRTGPSTDPAERAAAETAAAEPATAEPAQESAPADAATSGDTAVEAHEAAAPAAPQFVVADLSEDDAAAVDEVGAIEEELVAEGVELEELAPADFEEYDDEDVRPSRRRRRRGGRGRRGGRANRTDDMDDSADEDQDDESDEDAQGAEDEDGDAEDSGQDAADADGEGEGEGGSRRRRRRRRGTRGERAEAAAARSSRSDEVTALKGSTRLEAKRQRRREGRDHGRRRQIITEAEFLARRESVQRSMIVREKDGRTQIAVLEDGVLVEHYVSQQSQASMAGNVYLGRVQNVLPSMEAAFVDVGKGRNAVLYAGEVNWDAAGLEGQPRRIEQALKSGDSVLVQVTKDPIGHKGARLTSQVTLAGRYLVFVPGGGMTGISRKLPDTERSRLKKILREVVPDGAGVIVRTAAEGASEDELRADVERLQGQWDAIQAKSKKASAPALLQGEPDMAIRVVRDIFNDDFSSLVVQGEGAWDEIAHYVEELAPDLRERVSKWVENTDVFTVHRVDEQLAKGMDRKVWLPSGGSLVIDRTEAMTVVDVNTGKFTGAGGTLEETVTRNNLEAAEEIVRQLRLRDIGGIIVIDFIDMVLESNRDLVLRRLVECLGRDRTKHQVAEVTSLGLVQMTRKRVGQGLVEAFSETCEHCKGRGFIVHEEPIEKPGSGAGSGGSAPVEESPRAARSRRKRGKETKEKAAPAPEQAAPVASLPEERSEAREAVKATLATIAAAAQHAHETHDTKEAGEDGPSTLADIQLPAAHSGPSSSGSTASAESPASTGSAADAASSASDAPEGGSGTGQPEPPKGAGDEVA